MYRAIYYLGLVLVVFSFFGLVVPQSISVFTFLLPAGIFAIVSLLAGLILLDFSISAYLRKPKYKRALGAIGSLLLTFSILGIVAPTYFGLLPHYMRFADVAMFMVAGIGSLIAALEYDRPSLAEELDIADRKHIIRELLGWHHAAQYLKSHRKKFSS